MTSDSVETSIKLRLDQRPNHVQCQCQSTSNSICCNGWGSILLEIDL